MDTSKVIIVTRHPGLVEYLKKLNIEGEVVEHASAEDVLDNDVIGVLPYHLAALTNTYTAVDIIDLPQDKRGKELSYEELCELNVELNVYDVSLIGTINFGT